jgi:hypothetical protein
MTIQTLCDLIKGLVGHEILFFDTPVTVNFNAIMSVDVHAVAISPANGVYVMDGGEEFTQILSGDNPFIDTIGKRVQLIISNTVDDFWEALESDVLDRFPQTLKMLDDDENQNKPVD